MKVLAFYNGEKVLYSRGRLLVNGKTIDLQIPLWKRIISSFRIFERLLRLDPRCANICDDILIISYQKKIFVIDLIAYNVIGSFPIRDEFSNVLNICHFSKIFYWGDYGANKEHKEVNVYSYTKENGVSVVYTFPSNTIRHIHNIIYDKSINKFWILTGDNENEAGIYISDIKWKEVLPIKIGKTMFRAVVGFPYKDGLLYATDSVESDNFIYYLSLIDYSNTKLFPINGSCIYGGENKNCFYFSTTVEPHEGIGIKNLLFEKLGNGIKSRNVHLIEFNKKNGQISIIGTYRKDFYPMKLFQYGTIQIPIGQENLESLFGNIISCKNHDGKFVRLK